MFLWTTFSQIITFNSNLQIIDGDSQNNGREMDGSIDVEQ